MHHLKISGLAQAAFLALGDRLALERLLPLLFPLKGIVKWQQQILELEMKRLQNRFSFSK